MCVQIFPMVNIDVRASVGAPPFDTQLLVQRDFLTIPGMHFKASAIKAAQQDAFIRYQQLVAFHTAL